MTTREIDEEISEACGISICRHPMMFGNAPKCCNGVRVPADYCSDLNAMHEAEKTLNGKQTQRYQSWITRISARMCDVDALWDEDGPHTLACGFGLTARQRAEAFLRALGKWRE